jgi:hypothetical protein
MTDLTPNDLSHLSDAEFNSLCPQGEHAPGREPLSPAVQAVLDAYLRAPVDNRLSSVRQKLAAALLAAADQVVPEVDTMDTEEWIGQSAWQQAEQSVRFRFLAIAAELAGTPHYPR